MADNPYNGDLGADCQWVETLFQGIPEGFTPGETAVLFASRGLKVFPCEPDLKKPATARGFKDASTDVQLICNGRWVQFKSPTGRWTIFAITDCNLAFEPGSIELLIVDIDPKSGGNETWAALEAEHGKAPATLEVSTPSGGRHLYFRGIGPSTQKKLGDGIDTRGVGGYALLPPSSVNGKHYTWVEGPVAPLPEWIAEILATEADPIERSEENTAAYEAWLDEGNDGGRLDYYLSLIGDHEGGEGFYSPMTRAAGYGARLGMPLDEIVGRITEAARNADHRNHTFQYIKEKIAQLPQAVRSFQAKDASRLQHAEEEEEEADEGPPDELEDEPEEEEEEADEDTSWRAEDDTSYTSDTQKASSPDTDDTDTSPSADHWTAVAQGAAKLDHDLRSVFQTSCMVKRLFVAAMGLGKSRLSSRLLAELSDPAHPDPVSRAERAAAPGVFNQTWILEQDLGALGGMPTGLPPGQILYIAQRHDQLRAFANWLKEDLRARGWTEEVIERNVVILEARERPWLDRDGNEIRAPLCRRAEEVDFLKRAGGFSISKSLCRQPATDTKPEILCPFYEECEYQRNQRKAARARFVPDDPCPPKHTLPCATQD